MTAPKSSHGHQARPKKIVVCCDGTWENSLDGDDKPLSNVTRTSRSVRRTCEDGSIQVVYYHPGVGTGGLWINSITGGAFGMGLAEDIREAYSFICANYVDGDAIILTGFSRGAFTARSIADLIASIGLLTTNGMTWFYSIFEDYENMADVNRGRKEFLDDSFESLSPYDDTTGVEKIMWEGRRKNEYKAWLKKREWTRDTFEDGQTPITIKAVAVWDTFTNTHVSSKVENAFHALSMDEPRAAFRPALWERLADNTVTNLKQVWFPGSHGNVGGGWYDQQIACIALAWICDQLTTVGVEFSPDRLTQIFIDALRYGAAHPYPLIPKESILMPSWLWRHILATRTPLPWAKTPTPCPPPKPSQRADLANCTMKDHHPDGTVENLWAFGGRPWALGQARYPDSWLTVAAGTIVRRPGCFMRVDAGTNVDTQEPLLNTNERVHSSARVRLACRGLGMDDRHTWKCPSLLQDDSGAKDKALWRLERARGAEPQGTAQEVDFWRRELAQNTEAYNTDNLYNVRQGDGNWQWVLEQGAVVKNGDDKDVTNKVENHILPEEPLVGYWERRLLAILAGSKDVWRLAEKGVTNE